MSSSKPQSRPNPGQRKGGAKRAENNRIYGHPLPLTLVHPDQRLSSRFIASALGLFAISPQRIENPHCEGIFDPASRSVWIVNERDSLILWRRGFFGKGNLSRSEPSWLARQVNARKAAKAGKLTSEEVTAKRRAERKQFKLDRARAIAAAAAEAEAAFEQGRLIPPEDIKAAIPSAATWKPTPSTTDGASARSTPTADLGDDADPIEEEEEEIKDMEHLQLTLPEAFFLAWALDCLTVLHSDTLEPMTLTEIWNSFQSVHLPHLLPAPSQAFRPDNPFLINYVFHHHYRSLGWVVKNGIKFCVDYLLYKRGPVFHHAEFAFVLMPVYEDPQDAQDTPFNLQNADPFTWQWLSTINRVNSQVQKTLVLAYVTIPARSKLGPDDLNSPACLRLYSVREVTLRRFVPARMRD
ncbi:tRNA-intron endonuclease [Amylostereum chailletii]|nr:tRNA-intron endonuclease [Amylostereum chailletii]